MARNGSQPISEASGRRQLTRPIASYPSRSQVIDSKKTSASRHRPGKRGKAWETYENVARYVLLQIGKRFGLAHVEGKQKLAGRKSGTYWEIDAKGICEGNGAILLVECRRYERPLNQEAVAAVAYRIEDTGADAGIIVSPFPLQKGAAKVAAASRIEHVQLRPESTREQWIAQIGKVVHIGYTMTMRSTVSVEVEVRDCHGNIIERRRG